MTIDELIDAEPHTRRCRRCDVEINAASARCPYCGARQFRRTPILGWRGALVCLIAVGIAIAATATIVDSHHGRQAYLSYRSANLVALVPSNYRDLLLAAPHGTALAGWGDPSHAENTETVRATVSAGGTPQTRMAALVARLRQQPGVALGYHDAVVFPGGQPASEVEYTQEGVAYAVFLFAACQRRIAVTVTLSVTSEPLLNELSVVLPHTADAVCDGPAFSNRDRGDPAIPLAPSRGST